MGVLSFGQWLQSKRIERGLTLRQVETITERRVSNGYLSQLESGKIAAPSVLMLHKISAALALDFEEMCHRACIGSDPVVSPICPTCGQITPSPHPSDGGQG